MLQALPQDRHTRTAAELKAATHRQLLDWFAALDAPPLADLHGEYAARLLAQPGLITAAIGHAAVNNPLSPGRWLCKAFRPVGAQHGRGYNTFAHWGRTVQRFPMHTLVAPSRWDGRPAFQLVYRAYHSMCGDVHMVDEVREAAPGVYLGLGTWGWTERQRMLPQPFLLDGPVAPYRGDIGRPRAGFDLPSELPALRSRKTP